MGRTRGSSRQPTLGVQSGDGALGESVAAVPGLPVRTDADDVEDRLDVGQRLVAEHATFAPIHHILLRSCPVGVHLE